MMILKRSKGVHQFKMVPKKSHNDNTKKGYLMVLLKKFLKDGTKKVPQ